MSANSEHDIPNSRKQYEEFLLAEHNHIAQAHFNTVNSISNFFRYYLLVVALPVPLLALVFKADDVAALESLLDRAGAVVPGVASLLGLVGFLVMCYVANLRFDALLYARSVNGIRGYFTNAARLTFDEQRATTVLPKVTTQPRYFEGSYFLFVVLAFTAIDTTYVFIGWLYYAHAADDAVAKPLLLLPWLSLVASVAVHLASYWALSRYRETGYFRHRIVGVDIDGVLNMHREHFAAMLGQFRGVLISPAEIVRIPVSECKGLQVTEENETAVFNHVAYWRDMPPMDGASEHLLKLQNVLKYKIWVFSYRPWPEEKQFPEEKAEEYAQLWNGVGRSWRRSGKAITSITRNWLKEHSIPFARLIIERGNIYTTDRLLLSRNRFATCARHKIPIFVEDDLRKAVKLCRVCEIVFLVNHPYNQADESTLPHNLIRVESWQEIYQFVRDMF